jgi:predicted glycosyltransferase
MVMRIWIDLSNSPHVLLFRPIIQALEGLGHTVKITARDFAQTVGLADKFGLDCEVIGGHGGKAVYKKGVNLISHSFAVMMWALQQHIDLAVSHNTYSQTLAAFVLGIPSVVIEDYEYQPAHHLSFRLAHRVIVPQVFPEDALSLYGAARRKVRTYPGIKEQVYLSSFEPDSSFLSREGLDNGKIIATIRPPATFALYHRFKNPLFRELIEWLGRREDVLQILLPRTNYQRKSFIEDKHPNMLIPSHPLDGPNLLFHSDLVVSAGGTMNREAAVLGTPVYTIFAGHAPAVDDYLVKAGRMVRIQSKEDFSRIKPCKKRPENATCLRRSSSLERIVELILDVPVNRKAIAY